MNLETIRDKISSEVSQGFNTVSSTVASNTKEIMGDALGSLVDDIKSISIGTLNILKGGAKSIFGVGKDTDEKQLDETEKQTGILKDIWGYFKGEKKASLMGYKKEEKGFNLSNLLLGLTFGIGAIIGGLIGVIVKPFEVLFNAMKILKPIFLGIGSLAKIIYTSLNKIPIISKIFTWIGSKFSLITKMFSPIQKAFSFIIKGFVTLSKGTGLIGTLLKGVMKGFSKLAWPLTALLALFDFMKAFTNTQGSLIDKVKAGITAAIVGFLDLPLKIIGWLTDKFLGLFGIKIEGGVGNKLIEGLKFLIPKALDYLLMPFEFFITSVKYLIDFIKSIDISSILNNIKEVGTWFSNVFSNIWNWAKNKINNIINKLNPLNWFTEEENEDTGFITELKNILLNITQSIKNWILDKIPGADMLKGGIDKAKGWFSSLFGDDDEDEEKIKKEVEKKKSVTSNEVEKENQRALEIKARKEREQQELLNKNIDETKKVSSSVDRVNEISNKIANNTQIISSNNSNITNSNDTESPDEIENFGLVFMNKTTLGAAL